MARPLSIAELATVQVGESFKSDKTVAEVKRKADLYGKRHGKAFSVTDLEGEADDPFYPGLTYVTRLPDPEPQP